MDMFYSADEIYFMSKCHGEELKRSRENSKNKDDYEKGPGFFKLSLVLVAMLMGAKNRKEDKN
jgi:hypothetical protein